MSYASKSIAVDNDPLKVFASIEHKFDYCFLLETLADRHQPLTSGQSYIGVSPSHVFAAKDDMIFKDGEGMRTGNAYAELAGAFRKDVTLPRGYVGGLVGYFSHEGITNLEPTLSFDYDRKYYDFEFAQFDDGLIFQPDKQPEYFTLGADRSDLYVSESREPDRLRIAYKNANKDRAAYDEMIRRAQHDIHSGRVFQVVLANRYAYEFSGSLLNLYKELRSINPSPFLFYLKFGNVVTMGASPELLAHTNADNKVFLEALAGTIARGKDHEEDEMLAQKLLQDEKEVAEHSMLVDLARNDVGRISKIGTVKVEDLMKIKRLSHVQHISSVVSGEVADDFTAFDALASSFPAGTLSGAPKIESIKMISELEHVERGPYGGTIGYFSHNGESVHAVNIRSISSFNDMFYLHTGSGIVYDSNENREFEEIGEKKAAMDRAMAKFLDDGGKK